MLTSEKFTSVLSGVGETLAVAVSYANKPEDGILMGAAILVAVKAIKMSISSNDIIL